jgi:hypothetical protein
VGRATRPTRARPGDPVTSARVAEPRLVRKAEFVRDCPDSWDVVGRLTGLQRKDQQNDEPDKPEHGGQHPPPAVPHVVQTPDEHRQVRKQQRKRHEPGDDADADKRGDDRCDDVHDQSEQLPHQYAVREERPLTVAYLPNPSLIASENVIASPAPWKLTDRVTWTTTDGPFGATHAKPTMGVVVTPDRCPSRSLHLMGADTTQIHPRSAAVAARRPEQSCACVRRRTALPALLDSP